MITRRKLVQYLPLACSVTPTALAAADPKVIGILNPYFRADVQAALERFDLEMRHLGYVKGRHYIVIERMADGRNERLAAMARELVDLKVDLIFATPHECSY